MSTPTHDHGGVHNHVDAKGHGDVHAHDGAGHSSMRGYLIGFVLSVILTAVPFWLVMTGALHDASTTAYIIMGLALVQVLVHLVYFLHMNGKAEGGWTMLALLFTVVVLAISLVGSLWVMHHMNINMMPGAGSGDTSGM